jgi:cytochrome c
MSAPRAVRIIASGLALGCCGAVLLARIAIAQIPLPAPKPADGATLFRQQCGTCHTTSLSEPVRQGPPLVGIVGRHAGSFEHFRYSPGFAKADFTWDESRLDTWLTNPQEMIPGTVMAYRQAKPEVRATIIAYLKELK